MRVFGQAVIAMFILSACAPSKDFRSNTNAYVAAPELGVTGAVSLSFEQVSLSKAMPLGSHIVTKCNRFAADYTNSSGVGLVLESLKIDQGAPTKHCARRNLAQQCESFQYFYPYTCRYKTS